MTNSEDISNYVCSVRDLDKPLDLEFRHKVIELFYDVQYQSSESELLELSDEDKNPTAWRMFWKGGNAAAHLLDMGIDLNNLTVRDAVAFDVVKLDDGSVSNSDEYVFNEHVGYSAYEYERYLLNKNFRINLVNLNPEWSNIVYNNTPNGRQTRTKRSVDRVFQGIRLSTTILQYFETLLDSDRDSGFDDIYLPYTSMNDITEEFSLITNLDQNFSPMASRAYYDMKYINYKKTHQNHRQ